LLFADEAERIRLALGEGLVRAVEHIGSTAIPGLEAKPVIDLLVGVRSLPEARALAPPALEVLGYAFASEPVANQLFFWRGPADGPRSHHAHLVEHDGPLWRWQMLFRGYLRAHPEEAARYAALKRQLALRFPTDRVGYSSAKAAYIDEVVAKARQAERAKSLC
jgi:GrpB-like predicted nucleotidyltransferase (UPF0157 family)